MLFRRPKLIKVDVTKTRRNRDGHFAGKQQTVPCRPAFIRTCWRIDYSGPFLLQKISSIFFVNRLILLSAD